MIGTGLFAITFLAALMHIFYHGPQAQWLVFVTAVAPAFGAALFGIRSQGEFERIAKQSEAMSAELRSVKNDLTRLAEADQGLTARTLGEVAVAAASVMLSEVVDWRLLLHAKRLDLPG